MADGIIGTIIGIASIVITVLVYFLQKTRKYPGKLNFALVETWKVMRSSPDGYGELSLKYNNYEIEKELSYIKFILYNDKSFDYSSGDDDNPVRVVLPEGYKWIDAKIVGHSDGVQAEIADKNDRELNLKFKLLRKNEYFEIDGLTECSSNCNLNIIDKIKIPHRISNVSPVKKKIILNEVNYKRERRVNTVKGTVLVVYISVLLYSILMRPNNPLSFKDNRNGETHVMYIDKKGELLYRGGDFIWSRLNVVSWDEFSNNYEPYCGPVRLSSIDYILLSSLLLVIALFFVVAVESVAPILRTKRILKMLNDSSDQSVPSWR